MGVDPNIQKRVRDTIEAEAAVNAVRPETIIIALVENCAADDGLLATMLAGTDFQEIENRRGRA